MPVHNWTRVDAGIFHDFHNAWILELANALNGGLLPASYYALTEQHAGKFVADLLTLDSTKPKQPFLGAGLRRSLALRQVSGHRLVALIEIVSPFDKARSNQVQEFIDKAVAALEQGINLLVVDLFPPGSHDPSGMHGAIWKCWGNESFQLPANKHLTLVSYAAGSDPEAYLELMAVGDEQANMPLFLCQDRYISVPLEATYQAAFRGRPAFWREVLEK
jgi:hypothetical protein